MHPYQSQWMAHWMRTSCSSSSSQVHGHCTIRDECNEEDRDAKRGWLTIQNAEHMNERGVGDISKSNNIWRCIQGGLEVASEGPQFAKEVVTETRKIEITNESLMTNSKKVVSPNWKATQLDSLSIRKQSGSSVDLENSKTFTLPYITGTRSERWAIPKFDLNQKMEMLENTDMAICNREPSRPQIDVESRYVSVDVGTSRSHLVPVALTQPPSDVGFVSKEHHHEAEGITQTRRQQMKPYNFLDGKASLVLGPWQDDFIGLTSNSALHGFKSIEQNMKCCTSRQGKKDNLANDCFIQMEHELGNSCGHSTFLAYDTKMGKRFNSNSSGSLFSGEKDRAQKINGDPLKGHSTTSQGITALEDSKCGHHLLHRMPTCPLHDVDMSRICTTAEEAAGGPPKFSKATHHPLIMKKTDVNLFKGEKVLTESMVSTQSKGNSSSEILGLPPIFPCYDKQEALSRYCGNLINCEGRDDGNAANIGFSCIQNESSAETDTMPFDAYQSRNSPAGVTSSQLHKGVMMGRNTGKSQESLCSPSKEAGIKCAESDIPDMNEAISINLVQADHVDNRELSSSRTESLDVEHLLSHLEQPGNSNISPQQCGALELDPSSRWVKRLRSSTSDSLAFGTKSLKIGDTSSREKVNKLFCRIINNSKTNSEPTSGKCLGRGSSLPSDKAMVLLRNRESSSADSVKDHLDLSASYSWIQRWCRNREGRPQELPKSQVVCKPDSSKAVLKEFRGKQFPSIAAMALMRKAVNNFHPCEFRKKGSFVVWNSDGF
ncbi:uncharacterized protein LOC131237943 isoform X2 [Magnolia sinica]|uniref:uncharacterized protein LOC131237943 isoform X2 n=1 Tax=Magnolia sinica TaxID=86752 RepID=UPI00265A0638|nr:uncharacterized protein LOC131237943 isoform X2 [Magnolia sinica]